MIPRGVAVIRNSLPFPHSNRLYKKRKEKREKQSKWGLMVEKEPPIVGVWEEGFKVCEAVSVALR